MKIGNFNGNIGKQLCAFVLVGTIATYGCVLLSNVSGSKTVNRVPIAYSDEDVKKKKADLMMSINRGGNDKAKTYGKVKNAVSTETIKK